MGVQLACWMLLVVLVCPFRVYLVGGGANENSTQVFSNLANTTSRTAMPGKCNMDWTITSCPRIAVVTSAAADEAAGNDAYSIDDSSLSYEHLFARYGLAPKHISVHADNYLQTTDPSTPRGKANQDILNTADIVYFNGGDQSKHIRAWLKDDGTESALLRVLHQRAERNQIVVAGTSAGSMIWGKTTFGGGSAFGVLYFSKSVGLAPKTILDGGVGGSGFNDLRNGTSGLQYQDNAGKMPAFNWLPFLTDTHFNARGRLGRLVPILMELKQPIGFGVDEETVLFYESVGQALGIGRVFGPRGVTFVNVTNSQTFPMDQFNVRNVIGHYLTAGDQYDFAKQMVISSKPIIKSPYYSGATDSSDILKGYECTLLETRVVDQKSAYNVGTTKSPSGYPKTTPLFDIKFYRKTDTKGYFANKNYTVEGVAYDFGYRLQAQRSITSEE